MTFMGFVFNWSGLMAARWFLGLAEAGLFPGVNYYLSCWYKRSEFGIRAVSFPKVCDVRIFLTIFRPFSSPLLLFLALSVAFLQLQLTL
jgi:MFS family permease